MSPGQNFAGGYTMHRKIKPRARKTRRDQTRQMEVVEAVYAKLTERERIMFHILVPAIALLRDITPLATAYIRENMLEDKYDVSKRARKFLQDHRRYWIV